jgi:hypothetical protein
MVTPEDTAALRAWAESVGMERDVRFPCVGSVWVGEIHGLPYVTVCATSPRAAEQVAEHGLPRLAGVVVRTAVETTTPENVNEEPRTPAGGAMARVWP